MKTLAVSLTRRVAQVLGIGALGLSAVLLTAVASSAHTNVVSGTSVCSPDGYLITWTVANNYPLTEVATVTSSGVSPTSVQIAASPNTSDESTGTFSETVPGSSTEAQLTVTGLWSDGFTNSATGYVTLGGTCVAPPTTIATPPTTVPVPTTVPIATPVPVTVPPVAVAPVAEVAPVIKPQTTFTKVQHRPAVVVAGSPVVQATAVHTGEPFAGTLWLVELVAGIGVMLFATGVLWRRRRL